MTHRRQVLGTTRRGIKGLSLYWHLAGCSMLRVGIQSHYTPQPLSPLLVLRGSLKLPDAVWYRQMRFCNQRRRRQGSNLSSSRRVSWRLGVIKDTLRRSFIDHVAIVYFLRIFRHSAVIPIPFPPQLNEDFHQWVTLMGNKSSFLTKFILCRFLN